LVGGFIKQLVGSRQRSLLSFQFASSWETSAGREVSKLFPPLTMRWMNRINIPRLSTKEAADQLVRWQISQLKKHGLCHKSVVIFHIYYYASDHFIIYFPGFYWFPFVDFLMAIISVQRTRNFPVPTGNDFVRLIITLWLLNVVDIIIELYIILLVNIETAPEAAKLARAYLQPRNLHWKVKLRKPLQGL